MDIAESHVFEKPDIIILSHPRSGTHFLEGSLGSHPKVHMRRACLLQYQRDSESKEPQSRKRFKNKPGHINTAIVMYKQVELFEELCGPLSGVKIVHLLRDAEFVARSCVQYAANKLVYGGKVKAHYRLDETPPANVPIETGDLEKRKAGIERIQSWHLDLLKSHPQVFTVKYEDLTGNKQVTILPEQFSRNILAFMGLEYQPLVVPFQKTGYESEADGQD